MGCVLAVMSPYRDDFTWIVLREKDQSVTATILPFDTGMIRVPDQSAIPKSSLARWASNTNSALQIDAAGMTCAPEVGAEVFLSMDPELFRLRGLGANYVNDRLSFPYSNQPAAGYVDRISAKRWKFGKLEEAWSASGDGRVGSPILMAPVYGSSRVLQVSRGQHLMFKVMDSETGNNVLPICETNHTFPMDAGPSRLEGRRRFAAIAHRSSSRVAIVDFQTGELLSVRMFGRDHLEELPLEIRRKPGQEVRYPLKVPAGSTIKFSEYPGDGLRFDRPSNELVITDPDPKQLEPVMNFMVEVVDAAGIKTLFPFKILAGTEQAEED